MEMRFTQRDFRKAKQLPFCYLCGQAFDRTTKVKDQKKTRDHVPSKKIFSELERKRDPLIVPAHGKCNGKWSEVDEVMKLSFCVDDLDRSLLHKKQVILKHADGRETVGSQLPELRDVIWRYVRALHAAIHQEFLPDDTDRSVCAPLPDADLINGTLVPTPIAEQFRGFVRTIKVARATGQTRTLSAFGGAFIYEWAWFRSDAHALCLFAMDCVEWKHCGDPSWGELRACVGHYALHTLPERATFAKPCSEVPVVENSDPLDAFGS